MDDFSEFRHLVEAVVCSQREWLQNRRGEIYRGDISDLGEEGNMPFSMKG